MHGIATSAKTTLPTGLWRALALLAIAMASILVIGDLFHPFPAANFGYTLEPHGKVGHVEPRSAAARAGIVVGDTVRSDDGRLENRINFVTTTLAPGARLNLVVGHNGEERRRTLVAGEDAATPFLSESSIVVTAFGFIRLLFLIVAAIVVIRRPERSDARALASFFVAFGAGSLQRWPWYPAAVTLALFVLRPVAVTFALAQAVRFSALFPHSSPRGLRHFVERWISWSVVPAMLGVALENLLSTFGIADPGGDALAVATETLFSITTAGLTVALALGFTLGAREASPADRPRLRWVALSIAIGLGGLLPVAILESLGIQLPILLPLILLVGAIPIGTAYAILRHRMLDIGFVVNRALVFATVSALVVALFTLLEFIVGKYVTKIGHVQSFVLEALAALAIGASLRGMHDRADAFVDNVIFRARHRAERALRRLAREAAYVRDAGVLVERVVSGVERHADACSVALYERNGDDLALRYATAGGSLVTFIGRDDPAVVRARASGEPVDMQELAVEIGASIVPGVLAFPLTVRGDLIGLLACGQKRNDESYAPDERAVLAELAQATGMALDTLQTLALHRAVEDALALDDVEPLRAARTAIASRLHAP